MIKYKVLNLTYKHMLRPILFSIDSEKIHDIFTQMGEGSENFDWLLESIFSFNDRGLNKNVLGVNFNNPIGLAAGFDYDGHLASVMKHIGFGFNTVGTVTAKAYGGNNKPRLGRLIKSRSLLVNKGFKSEGALKVAQRLDKKRLNGHTTGISVGSSNLPTINTINRAISDYIFTFNTFKDREYVSYFELNISCPNTAMTESFTTPKNLFNLIKAVTELNLKKPLFVKMPSEITPEQSDTLIEIGLKKAVRGYIFFNLVKDRGNKFFVPSEIEKVNNLKGNFSGKPTSENSNKLIAHSRKTFGKNIAIIGCGGVFDANDAIEKLKCGADLVQLITGMIFEGPQIAGDINSHLIKKYVHVKYS